MQITSVDFLISFRCNSSCKHCCYNAGPSNRGYMKVADAKNWLSILASTYTLQSITVHGGEPLLSFPNYCLEKIVRYATELKVPRRGIITNGFWATDKITARRKLTKLKSSGLTSITFSVDGFHQEYIPIETVRIGLEEASGLGFTKVGVLSHYLVSVKTENIYNKLTN
jgi:MoaA/NifB/PqqE/SkfB family radical SAM enzyme